MKLLHKQLLAVCLPYLLLIAAAWIAQVWFIEPAERNRIRAETKRELNIQAAMIQQTIQRTIDQLKLISELPSVRSGDVTEVDAELKRITARYSEPFAAVEVCSLGPVITGTRMLPVQPVDLEQLNLGRSVVSNITGSPPAFRVMVPVFMEDGSPAFALVGELDAANLFPPLNSQADGSFSLVDAQGAVVNSAVIRATRPGGRWATMPNNEEYGTERASAQITPWNWQVVKTIDWRRALGPMRFQRNFLSALCLLTMFLTAAVVMWLNRKTSARLSKLIETIQVFGASDPSVRVADDQPDELGRLAETFNCMADDVAHAQRRLQKQLAEHELSPGHWKDRAAELERYASRLAHEFKGPLAAMEGFAAQLAAAAKAGDWEQFDHDRSRLQSICRELRDAGDALLRLADPTLPSQPVSLQIAANEAGERLALSPERLDVSDSLPTVAGDPILWRHVFTNLLQNAINAGADRIEVGGEPRDGDRVCFVRDNGRGMTAEELAVAFDGLGLGLVRRIIEQHGGKVWAEAHGPGTGMTIRWTVT